MIARKAVYGCHGLLIAKSVHSVSAGKEESLVRVLNPTRGPVTVYRGERLGILQSLNRHWNWQLLKKLNQDLLPTILKDIHQLQSRVQGL